jgi:DNA-directed RNA polymerase subunit beta'
MRTFHLGGTASSSFRDPFHKARVKGRLKLVNARAVPLDAVTSIISNKNGLVIIEDKNGVELESNKLVPGAILYVAEGKMVKVGQKYVDWDPYNVPIISQFEGRIGYKHLVDGTSMYRVKNKKTGKIEISVVDHVEADLHPQLVIFAVGDSDDYVDGEMIDHYSLPGGTTITVEEGEEVKPGTIIARTPRQSTKTKDITGGLPRVTELLEARRPKEVSEIAKIDGYVEISDTVTKSNKRALVIKDPETGQEEKHLIQVSKRIVVFNGDRVTKGQQLTDGSVDPHDILAICGTEELQRFIVNEVQMVYRLQGVEINDKHVEVIVRQMLRKVKVTDPGSSDYIFGEQVDKKAFIAKNSEIVAEGGTPAEADPVLLGITKAALETESFISAASFQDTTRILTNAATAGSFDELKGFKENVIMGQLIPAGTGHPTAFDYTVHKHVSDLVESSDFDEKTEEVVDSSEDDEAIANAKTLLDL